MKQNLGTFILSQKQKQLLIRLILMKYLNHYSTNISNIQKPLGIGSGWIIDSVVDYTIGASKYNLVAGSSYIKLPKELNHPYNDLINIKNISDDECLNWCLVRYLHLADHHPAIIRKVDKDFAGDLDFQSKLEM